MENELEEIKDLEFYFSDDMKQVLFDMIAIQELLNNESLSNKEIKKLEKEKQRLLDIFRSELQALNPVQVMIVRNFLKMKRETKAGL